MTQMDKFSFHSTVTKINTTTALRHNWYYKGTAGITEAHTGIS